MMFKRVKYLASCTHYNLANKLGQRGAEMVEYAIVLACIAGVAIAFYSTTATYDPNPNLGHHGTTLKSALELLWSKVAGYAENAK